MITNYSLTMLGQACNALVQQKEKEKKRNLVKPFLFAPISSDLVMLLSESLTGKALSTVCVRISSAFKCEPSAFTLEFGSTFPS